MMRTTIGRTRLVMTTLAIAVAAGSGLAGEDQEKTRVACVGDSITYGYGLDERKEESYPAVLGRLLGESYEVRNFGVNGATLMKEGDKPYWEQDAFKSATRFLPDVVVIKLGTNDAKPRNWKHGERFDEDLRAMVDHFRSLPSEPRIWLGTVAPVYQDRWGINKATVRRAINPIIRKVAEEEELPVIDFHEALGGKPKKFLDGIHPDAAGAKIMAKAVAEAIRSGSPAN